MYRAGASSPRIFVSTEPAGIESGSKKTFNGMLSGTLKNSIYSWAQQFRQGELTVEDVQDRFAAITEEDIAGLASDLSAGLMRARQELDAIRYGMCETGQRGEIQRIFRELESLMEGAHISPPW